MRIILGHLVHISGTKLPADYFYFHNETRLNGAGKRRAKEGTSKGGRVVREEEQMDFIQRARYFIMYVDTKRTRDGR